MSLDIVHRLREKGLQPSAQRLAVAQFVLATDSHPSADDVLREVQKTLPTVSRATVYNTLNSFVARGLIRQLVLSEGRVVFDPEMRPHHHFIDDDSGRIDDVPWDAVKVGDVGALKGYDVREYMVVMRGRKLSPARMTGMKTGLLKKR